jgi:hypothetical protein
VTRNAWPLSVVRIDALLERWLFVFRCWLEPGVGVVVVVRSPQSAQAPEVAELGTVEFPHRIEAVRRRRRGQGDG